LVDPSSGDVELLGRLQRVELTRLDPIEDLAAYLFGLDDPRELAGTARGNKRLDAFQIHIVAAPVARIGHDYSDAPLLAGSSQILPGGGDHRRERGGVHGEIGDFDGDHETGQSSGRPGRLLPRSP
jgi:hypothetical protein